jgi:hypothetical protein
MSEWWTYRPADFLMFAPPTYWRLFELHNEAWWPAQPLLLLAGLAWTAWLARRAGPSAGAALPLRVGAAGLAAASAFVATGFLLQRYAPINWAASAFAAGFLVQTAGLAVLAAQPGLATAPRRRRRRVGLLLCGWAVAGHPLLAAASGRPWTQAEVFGLAPDPTAIATLGVLLWASARSRPVRGLLRTLAILPALWCAISAATLWTMGSPQGWVPAAALLAAAWAARAAPSAARGRRSAPPVGR